jgi:Flp pilus assembly protein TadG
MPIVLMMVFGVVEVGAFVGSSLAVEHAAREGARAAAVSAAPAVAARSAVAGMGLDANVVAVVAGDRVTVTVSRRHRTDLPLIGRLLPDPVVSGSATMRREPSE